MAIDVEDPRYRRYLVCRRGVDSGNAMYLRFTDEDPADLTEARAVCAFATRDEVGARQMVSPEAIPDLVSLIDELLTLAGYELPSE